MNLATLSWRSLPYEPSRFFVKGTELAQAIVPGTSARFAIVEVRTLEADRSSGVRYSVRDAGTVSDAEVKAGVRPRQVASFDGLEEAVHWCLAPERRSDDH